MRRRAVIGAAVVALIMFAVAVGLAVANRGESFAEAFEYAFGILLRFWWWCLPTGAGLGLVLPAVARSTTPARAAFAGLLLALPIAATLFVAILIDHEFEPVFDVVIIEINGVRVANGEPNVVPFARETATFVFLASAPVCAACAYFLARQDSSLAAAV